jgi:NitT/TauT family transport system substrate-binding protein
MGGTLKAASKFVRATTAAAFLAASPGAAVAEKISIMVGGLEKQIYLPFKLTESLGYFQKEGLEVELLSQPSGVNAENEMLAGAVQGVGGFYDHCLDLQAKGKFVVSIVQINQTPGEAELVSAKHPEIKSPADFKGKSLGVTGLGSSTNFLTQYLAVKNGVKLGEFSTIPVGGGATFIAAIQQDKIQAGMTTDPTVAHLLKTGEAKVLVDLISPESTKAALGGLYPATALYMPAAWIETHKTEAQKLANALVKTLRFIHSHSAAEIASKMPADYYAGDKEGYIKALETGKRMFTADGIMPDQGPETVHAVLSAFSKNLQNTKINLAQTYTTEFVKNVQASD